MPKKRAVSMAERCPNCNAFLPAAGVDDTVKRCEYCGVELELPAALAPPPAPPPPRAAPPPPQAESKSAGSGTGLWIFLVPIAMSGSIFWFSQRRGGLDRTKELSSPRQPTVSSTESRSAADDPLNAPEPEYQTASKKPRRHGHDAQDSHRLDPCHVSGMQMSAVVDANQLRAKKCFESELSRFPTDVGLTSDWEVEIDGSGKVYTAKGRLHLLDFQRAAEAREQHPVALPGTSALSCMEGVVKGWSFPAYSPKDGARLRMKCSFNFVVKEL